VDGFLPAGISSRAGGMYACFPDWPGRSELGPRCLDPEAVEQSLAAAPVVSYGLALSIDCGTSW
jgi:hypothetical protein